MPAAGISACLLFLALGAGLRSAPAGTPVAPPPPPQGGYDQLADDITSFIATSNRTERATWGIVVQSLSTGERLFERNPGALLVPGSTLKLITAAVAAAAVGWDYAFETTVDAHGAIDGGSLRGDLVITGSGDPSPLGPGGDDFPAVLVSALRERGVARIEGRIIGDDDALDEPRPGLGWQWDDLGTVSGVVAGALNIAENTMRVTVSPGAAEGAPTKIALPPEVEDAVLINDSTTGPVGSPRTLWAEHRPGDAGLTIAGTLAAGARRATLTVAAGNPTLWFARVVRSRLAAAGIAVTGPAVDIDDVPPTRPAAATPGDRILTYTSPPLSAIVAPMLKESVNLYAESALRLAAGPSGPRSTEASLAAEGAQLEAWGVPADAYRIVDGSGMSRHNLITAEALVRLLTVQHPASGASPFVDALSVAGVDGRLAARMKSTPAADNARAKTGSMTRLQSLAGYVTTRDGDTLAFAIIVNNFSTRPSAVVRAIDRIVVRLAKLSAKP